jgi:hypothetical protein
VGEFELVKSRFSVLGSFGPLRAGHRYALGSSVASVKGDASERRE